MSQLSVVTRAGSSSYPSAADPLALDVQVQGSEKSDRSPVSVRVVCEARELN